MSLYIAVVGSGNDVDDDERLAEQVGRAVGESGAILVCGGGRGVMAAACRGAKAGGGTTVGILPGTDRGSANEWVDVALPTGIGEMRNVLVVRAADVVIAIGGEYGTLSEVAFALKSGVPVVGIGTWELSMGGVEDASITRVDDPARAVEVALQRVGTAG